jgi:hypothetical protein
VLTSTPLKAVLEEKANKRNTKKNISKEGQTKQNNKGGKNKIQDPNKTTKATKTNNKKTKNITNKKTDKGKKVNGKKGYRRKVLQETSSESDSDSNVIMCDDNSDDEMDDEGNTQNLCTICKEFGQDNEMWYRCTICSLWTHAMCSGWDSAEGYICDFCS